MWKTYVMWGVVALAVVSALGFGGWVLSLPPGVAAAEAPPVPQEETDALLAALKPPKRERPLIAVVGINSGTETNDYLMATGILRRAGVADVMLLSTEEGPVQLYPALKVESDATIAEFDAAYPGGADYVIVPAMSRDDDPVVLDWLRRQDGKGATIIGVCAGATVVAAAGLLDGKRATTHWYYLGGLLQSNRTIEYVADRRIVADGGVVTTTGITAAIPMSLTLIEAIAGHDKAQAVARSLGVETWNARHASSAFRFTRSFATTVLTNTIAFWNREEFGVRLEPGMDEVSLALVADAWSRTYGSRTRTYAAGPRAVTGKNGIRIVPDEVAANWPEERRVATFPESGPATALDRTLQAIASRYGEPTTNVVAMQLEYQRPASAR